MNVLRRTRFLSTPLAFFLGVVVSGAASATAATLITGANIQDNTVGTNDITNNSLTGTDIRNGTLDGYDLKPSGIAGGQIADRTLSGKDLALGSVSAAELAPAAQSKLVLTKPYPTAGNKTLTFGAGPVFLADPALVTIAGGQSITIDGTFSASSDNGVSVIVTYAMCSQFTPGGSLAVIGDTSKTTGTDTSVLVPFVMTLTSPAGTPAISTFVGPCASASATTGTSASVGAASYVLNITNP